MLFPDKTLTPEIVKGKLFSFRNAAHSLHLDTKSFAEHNALDKLYNSLTDFTDEISEKIMGYMNGRRIGQCKLDPLPTYSGTASLVLVNEIMNFSKQLQDWASKNNYIDIENISQSLSGLASQTLYRLTLI